MSGNKWETKQSKIPKVVIAEAPPCGSNEKEQSEVSHELSTLCGYLPNARLF